MSIACQTWEVGSGPTVGYKVAHQDGLGFRGYKHMHQPTSLVNHRLAPSNPPAEDLNGAHSSNKLNNNIACSSSSSIVTSSESSDDEKEVQSPFKGPLDQMDSLMSTLPIRRGLSKFYTGKSRSFTSLADVKSMSVKDLAKPENPYAKRRRLPPCHKGDRFPPPRVTPGISKKSLTSNGATLTLGVAMCTQDKGEKGERGWKRVQKSFSLTDLQKA